MDSGLIFSISVDHFTLNPCMSQAKRHIAHTAHASVWDYSPLLIPSPTRMKVLSSGARGKLRN
jgi:hypothetical protein